MRSRLLSQPLGRRVAADVHLGFLEIALCEGSEVHSAGRVPAMPEGIKALAKNLLRSDRVALEVTGRVIGDHPAARAAPEQGRRRFPWGHGHQPGQGKTDRLDARTLAKLWWTGELEAVWMTPEWIARMRRRLARRQRLVRARSGPRTRSTPC